MRHWGFSILLVLVASPPRTDAQESTDPLDRLPELRKELARIEQLPTEQQKHAIPRFYKDIHPILRQDCGLGSVSRQSYELLDKHQGIVRPLLEADLQSHDQRAVERALDVIGELGLKEFFGQVAAIFRKNDAVAEAASIALRDLDDPRAIRLLVDRHPQDPLRYFESLRHLCRSRPAEPALVKHLSAKDEQTRWRAAYALAESGDDNLTPHVQKLTKDVIPMVRREAGHMGFHLSIDGFARVRADLVVLLTDSAPGVRLDIACLFAWLDIRRFWAG
jgi:HEAT repeats